MIDHFNVPDQQNLLKKISEGKPLNIHPVKKIDQTWELCHTEIKPSFLGMLFWRHIPVNGNYSEMPEKTIPFKTWLCKKIKNPLKSDSFLPPVFFRSNKDKSILQNLVQILTVFSYVEATHNLQIEQKKLTRMVSDAITIVNCHTFQDEKIKRKVKKVLEELDQAVLASNYRHPTSIYHTRKWTHRIDSVGKIIETDFDKKVTGLYVGLEKEALKWLQKNFDPSIQNVQEGKEGNDRIRQLRKICRYPKYVEEFLVDQPENLDFCFDLLFRTNFPVKLLVQYPSILRLFKFSKVADPFGRAGKDVFKFNKDRKIWEIKINSLWMDFNLETKIYFQQTNETYSLADIFEHLRISYDYEKKFIITPEEGVVPFDTYHLKVGKKYVDVIKYLRGGDEPLFPKFHYLTKKQVLHRFGKKFDPSKPFHFILAASKHGKKPNDFLNAHGWFNFVIKKDENSFEIISFGKFPEIYPDSVLGELLFLGNTKKGVIAYPDFRETHKKSKTAFWPFSFEKEDFDLLVTIFAEVIEDIRNEKFFFQFAGENCLHLPIYLLQELERRKNIKLNIPDVTYPVEKMESENIVLQGLVTLLKKIKKVSTKILVAVFWFGLDLLLCVWRKKVITLKENEKTIQVEKSVKESIFVKERKIYSPSVLIIQAEKNSDNAVIHYGLRPLAARVVSISPVDYS